MAAERHEHPHCNWKMLMAHLQQARGLLLHSWPHQCCLLAGYLWLNEVPIQVQRHKVLHGVSDLISPQTPQNQQLLEGIKLSFPLPRQGLSAEQLGEFWGDVADPAAPRRHPSCLQAATGVSEGTRAFQSLG